MSQTHRKRSAPGGYTVGTHAIKKSVNDWILEIYGNIRKKTRNVDVKYHDVHMASPERALILESGACQTVKAIVEQNHILEENIVIPNPDESVLGEIRTQFANVKLFQKTSHEYLDDLQHDISTSSDTDDTRAISSKAESFDLVWLDYCGTLNSRAGRRRKEDIASLFSKGLLNKDSLLVITLSERGSPVFYDREIVDSLIAYVQHECAKQKEYPEMHCVGVACYTIKAKMCTVAFSFHDDDGVFAQDVNVDDSFEASDAAGRVTEYINFHNKSWKLFDKIPTVVCGDANSDSIAKCSPLFHAYSRAAAKFATLVDDANIHSALVLDNKLLPVTTALSDQSVAVTTVLSNPEEDQVMAEYRLRNYSTTKTNPSDSP